MACVEAGGVDNFNENKIKSENKLTVNSEIYFSLRNDLAF